MDHCLLLIHMESNGDQMVAVNLFCSKILRTNQSMDKK